MNRHVLSLRIVLSILCTVASLAGAACSHNTRIGAEANSACSTLRGTEAVTTVTSDLDYWTMSWTSHGLITTAQGKVTSETRQNAPKNSQASILGFVDSSYSSYTVGNASTKYRVRYPVLVSPDGAHIAVGLYLVEGNIEAQTSGLIGILNANDHTLIRTLKLDNTIRALAWSPDSQEIITFESKDVSSIRTAKDAEVAAFGFRAEYNDLFLTIYSLDGQRLCSTEIGNQVPDGNGFVLWKSTGT